jgi:hypothetical protein
MDYNRTKFLAVKKCTLHIGHPKTGTSFIQANLHAAAIKYHNFNIHYPLDFSAYNLKDYSKINPGTPYAGNAMPLFRVAQNDDIETLDRIARDLFCKAGEITILSSENLFYFPEISKKVQRSLIEAGFSVQIVCLLPNIFLGACNCYMQRVKNHFFFKSMKFYIFMDMKHKYGFDYKTVLAQHFDRNLTAPPRALPYMQNFYKNNSDILDQFFSLSGLPVPLELLQVPDISSIASTKVNKGICAEKMAIIKLLRSTALKEHLPEIEKRVISQILSFDTNGFETTHAINYLLTPNNIAVISKYIKEEGIVIDKTLFYQVSDESMATWTNMHTHERFRIKTLNADLMSEIFEFVARHQE